VIAPILLCALLTTHAPGEVVIAGGGREARLPVLADAGGAPIISAPLLLTALNGSVRVSEGWAEVVIARQPFRFLVGAPLYIFSNQLEPMAAPASLRRDTLYLPFQFVAEILPYYLSERYRYDGHGRLEIIGAAAASSTRTPEPGRLPNGLRPGHSVTIDPGHGGIDPGNPGVFFPRGMREKDVTLAVGLLLRGELRQRGVTVRMTRTRDTLIALGDRGGYCTQACDLFVSLHVNSLARRPGYTDVRGFETYFLAEARTEDAARVAKMENDAVRFEPDQGDAGTAGGLDFILKDLQLNEHLRESARAAELVQRSLGRIHTGESRGVKQAGFMVLTTARRPAILVEMGYSTNPDDGRFLTNRSSQQSMASALADAVVQYLLEYERKTGAAGDSGAGR
jgi:N-acetylmuramoyl-L-alanine amidase